MKVLDHLLRTIRESGVFNPDIQVAPPASSGPTVIANGKPLFRCSKLNCQS